MSVRREQLLDLAEGVLEREGIAGFGVNGLAREAGIRPPSIYKHFAGAAEIEHALIARWFRRLASALDEAEQRSAPGGDRIAAFALAYRTTARSAPQLYRLATERPLDRVLLASIDAGAEGAAMRAMLSFFGENEDRHDAARLAWAAAHGLVSLELAGRFPPGADLDASWRLLAERIAAEP